VQAAARRQKRDRLEHIGLASAIRPEQHDRLVASGKRRGAIVAEVGERDAADHLNRESEIGSQKSEIRMESYAQTRIVPTTVRHLRCVPISNF